MRRSVFLSLLVLALASLAGQSALAQDTFEVMATNALTFDPAIRTINAGDTVMWTNLSGGTVNTNHNVVEEDEANWNNGSFNPNGGFNSGAAGSTAQPRVRPAYRGLRLCGAWLLG